MIQSVEVRVGEFAEAALGRVRGARDSREAVHLVHDAFAVALASGGLEDVLRLARACGSEPGAGAGARCAG